MLAISQAFGRSLFLSAPADNDRSFAVGPGATPLTRREVQVLTLVAQGHSNAEVAQMLWVTNQTVKFHLSNVFRKLGVSNRTLAASWARDNGLLDQSSMAAVQAGSGTEV